MVSWRKEQLNSKLGSRQKRYKKTSWWNSTVVGIRDWKSEEQTLHSTGKTHWGVSFSIVKD